MKYLTEQLVFALRTSSESTEHVVNAQQEHHTTTILNHALQFVKSIKYLTVKVVFVPRTLSESTISALFVV
jgi:hypothetical protein